MANHGEAESLIEELLYKSGVFSEQEKSYQLLQCYFEGFPVETLKPLILHKNIKVRAAAAFIASELVVQAEDMVREITPLINDDNPHTQWYALESVMVCSEGKYMDQFVFVKALEINMIQ